ncbi:hypothetical protein HHK36_015270 [Tetracentron sinense]|uniref:Uncharacterized protein n=1 Tax=Tetracentron sinense TaxID=13715 RepID=A0A835DDP9_TETSI|nr:hypothetical protein HHK36_015270 [Tetracentron sinense]
MLMFGSIVLFYLGMRVYVYIQPEGSIFSGIAQVLVATYKKRHLKLPTTEELPRILYDPPLKGTSFVLKLPLTHQFRILNKAAIIVDGELNPDGSRSPKWRLCSIQQVEGVKCLIRILNMGFWYHMLHCNISTRDIYSVTSPENEQTPRTQISDPRWITSDHNYAHAGAMDPNL